MATSRGAGAAQRGYDYKVYKKGGKVKKYADGGALPERDPQTGTRQYASFSDWMGDLFGKKKVPASAMDETNMRAAREAEAKPAAEPDREGRPAPGAAKESLPTAPRPARPSQSAAQRRMVQRRRQDQETMARDVAESGRGNDPRARLRNALENEADARFQQSQGIGDDPILAREAAARHRQAASGIYAKGGAVKKYASGGSVCRGMGAATKGGKYKIK